MVVLRVVRVHDANDPVLGAAEPAFFEVLEDDFYPRFGAGNVAGVSDGNAEGAWSYLASSGNSEGKRGRGTWKRRAKLAYLSTTPPDRRPDASNDTPHYPAAGA